MDNLQLLKAILILANLLNFSQSYKQTLIDKINAMIANEEK